MSQYHIKTLEEYLQVYKKSVNTPELFWNEIAEEHFVWHKKWTSVLEWDFKTAKINWFKGAKLNITENCLDRHLISKANQTALIFEPNHPKEKAQHITYIDLYERVCKMANVLKQKGIKKGDRVCIYLPMIPELTVSILACARIGAVHSVVFAGFSASALASRLNDCDCKMIITSDGSFRGEKIIPLKSIVDEALEHCDTVESVLVVNRTQVAVTMVDNRDYWVEPLLNKAANFCKAEIMEAEDPLFILYTSGSTGKPKGMLHTTAGYMVYTAYTFKNVFNYNTNDIYWCTADVGWITGHSYIIYGPLCNGATSLLFEGVPSYPDYSRFWQIVEKHKVNQFYTAPTAIRALAKEGTGFVKDFELKSLKVIGTVGEPINEEAWQWYNEFVGKQNCPIVDTWFQTETGGIMITSLPNIIPTKPTFTTLPFIGVQLALMDDSGKEIQGKQVSGNLTIKFPWPSMARTIWGDHKRYKDTYFSTYKNHYFTGDGALRDNVGYYRITGRVDDIIIVSGHNLGTAPIEDAINEHLHIAESAVVGFPHDVKGHALHGFITLKDSVNTIETEVLKNEINQLISSQIGKIAKLDKIQFTSGLPKTRSGKIMRRILRKIAENDINNLGDISTLLNPECVQDIIDKRL